MNNTVLSIKNIKKTFGNITAVDDFSLDISTGEFITILGPSGCGKTTLLRIISGLEKPDSGNVYLDGENLEALQPEERNVNTVFQNYALFPHMNVFNNIAYGLKLRKINKMEIKNRVTEVLKLVQLEGYENRKISQLSGGQKQRVAIARAIVLKPKVLLLDEPLGALDYKLRVSMQDELKKMQKALNTTFLYITHDQDEALNLSDRIVLMNNARIEQIGTPAEIYKSPKSLFAANFIGEPNIIKAEVSNNECDFKLFVCNLNCECDEEIYAIVRPESVVIDANGISAVVTEQFIKGGIVKTILSLPNGQEICMHGFDTPQYKCGDKINVTCKPEEVHYIKQKIQGEKI